MSAAQTRQRSDDRTSANAGTGTVSWFLTLFYVVNHNSMLLRRTALIWGAVLSALAVVMVAVFPTFSADSNVNDLVESLPDTVLKALGIGGTDFTTIDGFLSLEYFSLMAPLGLAFLAIVIASRAIAGAEERGQIDLLLSNPLPRWQMVVGTFISMITSLLLSLAMIGASLWITAQLVDVALDVSTILEACAAVLVLSLFFGTVALLASSAVHQSMVAIGIAGGLVIVMYFLNALAGIVSALDVLKYASAFYYYGTPATDGLDWGGTAGVLLVCVALVGLASLMFTRKDIYS